MADFLCSSAYAASKGAGPVAHWRFDEGGGQTAYDESANNNDGTLAPGASGSNTAAGQMWSRQGKIGGALECDGTNDYVDLTSTSVAAPGNAARSIFAWIKTSDPSTYRCVLSTGTPATGQAFNLVLYGSVPGIVGVMGYANDFYPTTGTQVNNGNWHFIGAVYDGAGTIKTYVDGSLQNSGSMTYSTTGQNNYIGKSNHVGNEQFFNGLIDDVRIYSYARTADQIMVDYNAGSAAHLGAGTDPNEGNPPVGYWALDENMGTTAYDRSGNGYNGTIANATWAMGKHGSALSFDGTGDYAAYGTTLLNNQTAQTISAWIYINSLPTSDILWGLPTIIHKGNVYINFGYDENGKLFGYYYNSSSTPVTTIKSSSSMATGVWYHVVWTWTASSTKLYINGREEYSGTNIGPGYNLHASHANGDVRTGLSPYSTAQGVNGRIDDVKIYDYALTPAQIAWDYNAGKPVGHWRMNEATTGSAVGTSNIKDDSDNGYNGSGAGTNIAWADGKFGGALSFNGTNDYVNIPMTLSTPMSISAWVKLTDFSKTANTLINGNPHTTIGISLNRSGNGETVVYLGNGSGWAPSSPSITSSKNMAVNTWYHVEFTSDGTSSILYINGANVGSSSYIPSGFGSYFHIGEVVQSGEFFKGFIDDYRIYNYARTQEQVQQDYMNGASARLGD